MNSTDAARALAQAFKDVVNATDNGQPYTLAELTGESFKDAHDAVAVVEGFGDMVDTETVGQTTTRPTFTFDGFGINGPDQYRSRLATFTRAGQEFPNLGPMLEAAPDMLETLRAILNAHDYMQNTSATEGAESLAQIMADVPALLHRARGVK